jgi:hypothetical protein
LVEVHAFGVAGELALAVFVDGLEEFEGGAEEFGGGERGGEGGEGGVENGEGVGGGRCGTGVEKCETGDDGVVEWHAGGVLFVRDVEDEGSFGGFAVFLRLLRLA